MAVVCRADQKPCKPCPERTYRPWSGAMGRTRQAAVTCREYLTITSPLGESPKPPRWTPIEGGEGGGV
ncbi:hypothetical protein M9458_010286, partial [Cirrhinus mrigala]